MWTACSTHAMNVDLRSKLAAVVSVYSGMIIGKFWRNKLRAAELVLILGNRGRLIMRDFALV